MILPTKMKRPHIECTILIVFVFIIELDNSNSKTDMMIQSKS